MPWKIFPDNSRFCVHQLTPSGNRGKRVACHNTREQAARQIAALNANESKSDGDGERKNMDEDKNKSDGQKLMGSISVVGGARSFSEMDMIRDANEATSDILSDAHMIPGMVENIMNVEAPEEREGSIRNMMSEFVDRAKGAIRRINGTSNEEKQEGEFKTEGGVRYRRSDYAYTPNGPSTWKLRIAEGRSGNVTVSQLGRAAAAFSSGGFRGNRVQIPSSDVGRVKAKLRSEYRKLGVKPGDIPESIKQISNFFAYKDTETGRWRWITRYSNNFRDNDHPPEIISAKSHKNFVRLVDSGKAELPELWLWHQKEWRVGKADWVAWDDVGGGMGFAVAGGHFDKECEWVAKALSSIEEIGVSHGMPTLTIDRDEKDATIITAHITTEISPLPPQVAANKFADFQILNKENDMSISAEKREAIVSQWGIDPEKLAALEERNVETASKLADVKTDFKEVAKKDSEEAIDDGQITPPADPPPDQGIDDVAPVNFSEEQLDGIAGAIRDVVTPIAESVATLQNQVIELSKAVTDIQKSDEEKIAEVAKELPQASLQAMLFRRVVGDKNAEVSDKTLLEKKPAEAKEETTEGPTSFPFVNSIIAGK